jgi:hypothetical protein
MEERIFLEPIPFHEKKKITARFAKPVSRAHSALLQPAKQFRTAALRLMHGGVDDAVNLISITKTVWHNVWSVTRQYVKVSVREDRRIWKWQLTPIKWTNLQACHLQIHDMQLIINETMETKSWQHNNYAWTATTKSSLLPFRVSG